MRCVAYLRVSTEKQVEGNGLESQKRDIIEYAKKNNMLIAEWYIDDGYTGSNLNRPALEKLINDCCMKKITDVIAFKLDRLSRGMIDGLYLIEKIFIPNGVKLQCVHDSINYNSPMEQAYTQMMAVFAQLDKNTMMLRMRGGMLERVKKGYWMGGGVLPYCYTYDKNTGILVPIQERKKIANVAMDLFIEGYSDARIRDVLGFKCETSVRKILTSPVNIGMIEYKGELYNGLHEPIFELEKFQMAQEIRKGRKKKRMYTGPKVNMLTGLCYCGICGCAMRYQKWGPHNRHKIYCCSNDKHLHYLPNHNPNCNNTYEWAKHIEQQVITAIQDISINIDNYIPNNPFDMVDTLKQQLDSYSSKLKRLYLLYAEGNDSIVDAIKEVEEQKQKTKEELAKIETKPKASKDIILSRISTLKDVWGNTNDEQKNRILKTIIDRILITNDNVEIQLKEF